MKKLRIAGLLVFLITTAVFTIFMIEEKKETDKAGPAITIENSSLRVSVKEKEERLLEGVTARDEKDGNVTESVTVEKLSNFITEGKRLVSYAAFDSDHHVTKGSREIIYTDYAKPQFYLTEPMKFPVGTTDLFKYMTVTDCLDGDLSDKIKISPGSSVTADIPGQYPVRFQAANSGGDVAYLPVTVELYEPGTYNQTPQIKLKKYMVYTELGKRIYPKRYLDNIQLNGLTYELTDGEETYGREGAETDDMEKWSISTRRIRIINQTDYQKPGTYEILYSMTTEEGITGSIRLIVVVQEPKKEAGKDGGEE